MTVTVRLFARARDLVGADHVVIDLSPGANAGDLRRQLAIRFPALAPLLERSAIAVGGEFAQDDQLLSANSEIALLPPVSGG
jgi:molybdopterin converting factor subunit 1